MIRYLSFFAIWAGVYLALTFTGEWYYDHYQVYQASVALFLLYTSQTILKPFWWRKELGIVLTLQILLNCGDALYDWPPARYNTILDTLNFLELAIILIFGIGTFVHARMKKHESNTVPDHLVGRAKAPRKGVQEHNA